MQVQVFPGRVDKLTTALAIVLIAVAGMAAAFGSPAAAAGATAGWRSVSSGDRFSCAIRTDATLWCWGNNTEGQVGDGTTTDRSSPTQVGTNADWTTVATGVGDHACGIRADGSLWCWGYNWAGQLGDGTEVNRSAPVQAGTGATWTAVATGNSHTCAIRSDRTLWCWGQNHVGQFGDGTSTWDHQLTPLQVNSGTSWSTVSAGWGQTCATRVDGSLWCWGDSSLGEVGDGTTTRRLSPVRIGGAATWTGVAAGNDHTCAVRTDGTLWCWGNNTYGQLGDGTATVRTSPVQVGSSASWTAATVGLAHTCATRTDGSLWCWGDNEWGQVGNGSKVDPSTPVQIGAGAAWAVAGPGNYDTCATRVDGSLWCWGVNRNGDLALPLVILQRLSPTQVG